MSTESFAYFDLSRKNDLAILRTEVPEIRQPLSAQEFGTEAGGVLNSDKPKKVLIDLHKTGYLCSTAFATLLNLAKLVDGYGGVMKICGMKPDVLFGANVIGLGRAVEIHADEHAALASF
jgi:anti-anti-sigma factor